LTDTCSDCHKFYNNAKDAKEKEATINQNDVANNPIHEIASNVCAVADIDRLEYEKIILDASKHIEDAVKMQNYANKKMHESLQDKIDNKPWSKMRGVSIADYCQNMECPYFGLWQPGNTYYFSLISVFCFGVSNVGIKDHSLRAYIYLEGEEGKKGRNNVASLLMKHLSETGCIDNTKGPRKELTIIMDNCSGQNKN